MKKIVLVTTFIVLMFACSKKDETLRGYFYDEMSSDLYLFENEELYIYYLLDSVSLRNRQKFNNGKIQIDGEHYLYEHYEDELTIFDLKGININTSLKRIKLESFDVKKIDQKCWKMEVDKKALGDNKRYLQEQFVKIDFQEGLDFFYRKNNDTLYGGHYDYSGFVFNKFNVFMRGPSTILIYGIGDNEIKTLLYDGYNSTLKYEIKQFIPIHNSLNKNNF